jgi:hypothetical protein
MSNRESHVAQLETRLSWLGSLVGALALVSMSILSPHLQAQTLEAARDSGIAWLIASMRDDGSWAVKPESAVATTATVLQAFKAAGIKPSSFPHAMAVTWLLNAKPESIDSLARQIASLPLDGPGVAQKLSALRAASALGEDQGWGAYPGFFASFPDTPLALAAYRAFGQWFPNLHLSVYCEILPAQLSGGGWGYFKPFLTSGMPAATSAAIVPTVYNILELKAINVGKSWDSDSCTRWPLGPFSILAAISSGRAYLLTQKNADGGFGPGGISSVLDTALAYLALRTLNPSDPDAAAALNFLLSRQDNSATLAHGSWSSDPFQTALVLSTLPAPSTPLVDTDNDGIPDGVELRLGSNPNIADSDLVYLAVVDGRTSTGLSVAAEYSAQAIQFVAFTGTLTAAGGTLPYSWSIAAGTLPPGLTLGPATGAITGSPSTPGTFPFTVAVTDAKGVIVNFVGTIVVLSNEQLMRILFLILNDD